MGGVNPQADQLRELAVTIVDGLSCRGWPHRMGVALVGLWRQLSPVLSVSFVELVGLYSGVV